MFVSGLFFFIGFMILGIFLGAIIYRISCLIVNRLIGGAQRSLSTDRGVEFSDKEFVAASAAMPEKDVDASANPYASPIAGNSSANPVSRAARGIPQPGFVKSALIMLVVLIANVVVRAMFFTMVDFAGTIQPASFSGWIGVVIQFCVLSLAGMWLLPTSIGKSALVSTIFVLISAVIFGAFFAVFFLFVAVPG